LDPVLRWYAASGMESTGVGRDIVLAEEDAAAELRLRGLLADLAPLAVAFSGGVDSSYLLALALESAGENRVRALLGVSPSLGAWQRARAHELARFLGVELEEVPTAELEDPGYRANLGDRCFFCKDVLFRTLRGRLLGETLVEGTNSDDLQGHRPGKRAARALDVRSPLADAGLSKAAIRRLSRARGLPTADLPASPCLASRIPAGRPVTGEALRRIEAAEALLREEGFREFRVRDHGDLARLEIPLEEARALVATDLGARLVAGLRQVGYRFVSLDLAGFRSGSGSLLL